MISKFGVDYNDKKTKTTAQMFKINFMFSTTVNGRIGASINANGFKFIAFEDILSKKLDTAYLVGKYLKFQEID